MFIEAEIDIHDRGWKKYFKKSELKSLVEDIFRRIILLLKQDMTLKKTVEIGIICTNNREIEVINGKYRGKNSPTNVLSFPLYENEFFNELKSPANPRQHIPIGDIILALEYIKMESLEQSKSFKDHLTHLLIHGMLHLLGFNHENGEEADKMEAIEIELLGELGIANPYL